MSLEKSFQPAEIEAHWYPIWAERGYFRAGQRPDAPAFCIQLPPPNVTGTLHMGHAFNQTLIDMLARYHRMRGENVLWLPGTDHAGIATQIVVERQLQQEGTSRQALGREAFLRRIWEWKKQSGGTITQQMRRLGASTDWDLEYFTMDAQHSSVVQWAFVQWYQQGLIYRGRRLVNWDPQLLTAVSDLEVTHTEEEGSLWHIRYPSSDGQGHITVATTRPETLWGDEAVMVHPNDPRYSNWIGKTVRLPLSWENAPAPPHTAQGGREIPVIADEQVDPSFGSGAVKVTPAHDFNDYAVGVRHKLPLRSIFTKNASLNEQVPERYRGMDRFQARQQVIADLSEIGLLAATQPHKHLVPRSERTGSVIEPRLTDQWFVAMHHPSPPQSPLRGKSLAQRALEVVDEGLIQFLPEHWIHTYRYWLTHLQDWCIARQLWWGHQIPAWYKADDEGKAILDGTVFVAMDSNAAQEQAEAAGWTGPIVQDPDVLDTWFSSGLLPFSTLAHLSEEGTLAFQEALRSYFPWSVLVTGFDILFFWVARMIIMSLSFTGSVPFHTVYVHALVRDAQGQKMSKSKGNTLDPLDLIDGTTLDALIKKRTQGLMNPKQAQQITTQTRKEYPDGIKAFGVDALRFTFAALAVPGRDIHFDYGRCEGYRNFCNKLWNATRFILLHATLPFNADEAPALELPERWIFSALDRTEQAVATHFQEHRFDLVAQAIYTFTWDQYCDWYLELAKVHLAAEDLSRKKATCYTLLCVMERLLRLAHPIIPFITETLWQKVAPLIQRYGEGGVQTLSREALQTAQQEERFSIMTQPYPQPNTQQDPAAEAWANQLKALVNGCRTLRGALRLSPSDRPTLLVDGPPTVFAPYATYVRSLAKLGQVSLTPMASTPNENGLVRPIQSIGAFHLMLDVPIDACAELERLQQEISKAETERDRLTSHLDNPQFVERAAEKVVTQHRARVEELSKLLDNLRTQTRWYSGTSAPEALP